MNNLEIKISECIEDQLGGDWGKDAITDVYAEKVRCIRGADIDSLNIERISGAPFRYIKLGSKAIRSLSTGDIIIEISGGSPTQSTGRTAIITERIRLDASSSIVCSNFCRALRVKSDHDPSYIFYNLQNIYKRGLFFNFEGKTTGIKNLDLNSALSSIPIRKLDIEQERNIANVLSTLDSKVILNNSIISELETMSKLLYDYWFVQFDFPNKKGKPYKASGGKMVWNEELKRDIPEGWTAKKMADWIEIDKSGDWGKEEPEGNYVLKVNCIRGTDINGINGLEECDPPVRYILEKNAFKVLNSHDLIIEISGGSPTQSTGRLAYITEATQKRFENPLICSNFCKAISIKDKKLLYNFVYYWNSLYDNKVFFGYEGKTSGIKNLLFDTFVDSYWTVVPDKGVVEKFYAIMESIQAKKQTALAENQRLAELRDWLLPMLMNGQVKVK